jgi:hypothetical protein
MQGILEDIQLLSCEHGMKTATKAQQEQLTRAIKEVSAIVPSVSEQEFQETKIVANYSGSGTNISLEGNILHKARRGSTSLVAARCTSVRTRSST